MNFRICRWVKRRPRAPGSLPGPKRVPGRTIPLSPDAAKEQEEGSPKKEGGGNSAPFGTEPKFDQKLMDKPMMPIVPSELVPPSSSFSE